MLLSEPSFPTFECRGLVSDRRCSSALPLTFLKRSAKPLSTASPGMHPYRVQTRGTADRRIITAASSLRIVPTLLWLLSRATTLPHRIHVRSRLPFSHSLGSYAALSGHSSSEAVCAGFNALETNSIFSENRICCPAWSLIVFW